MKDEAGRPDLSGVPKNPGGGKADVSADAARKSNRPETLVPDTVGNKYLRMGDNFHRSAKEKPVFSIKGETIRIASDAALHDAVKIAKANDWSSVTVKGSRPFKQAAYMIAAKQGLAVEGYRPTKLEKLEVERAVNKAAERETMSKAGKQASSPAKAGHLKIQNKALSERFLVQSHRENRGDLELKEAQSLVAAAVIVARDRYPDNAARRHEFVEQTKRQLAVTIAAGNKIKGLRANTAGLENIQERIWQNLVTKERSKTRAR